MHTKGEVKESESWAGEWSQAGIDHDGEKDIFTARSFARHVDESIDFTITVETEGRTQEEAGEQALKDIKHLSAIWNGAKDRTTPQAVAYMELGPEMEEELKWRCDRCYAANEQICDRSAHDHNCKTAKLLTLLAKLDKLKEVE